MNAPITNSPNSTAAKSGDWVVRLSERFRSKRSGVLRGLIEHAFVRHGRVRVIDLGGRLSFWQKLGEDFLHRNNVHVTILNLSEGEAGNAGVSSDRYSFVVGDATATEFADDSFDIAMSNSVIEHLFSWEAMVRFADETRRIAPVYYCQTPNYWFPIDPHYAKAPMMHWMPRPTRAWLLRTFPLAHSGRVSSVRKSFAVTDAARLLCWTQMRDIFPDATLVPERFLWIFVKSWMAVREGHATAG